MSCIYSVLLSMLVRVNWFFSSFECNGLASCILYGRNVRESVLSSSVQQPSDEGFTVKEMNFSTDAIIAKE